MPLSWAELPRHPRANVNFCTPAAPSLRCHEYYYYRLTEIGLRRHRQSC
jgi:hypothetical protein